MRRNLIELRNSVAPVFLLVSLSLACASSPEVREDHPRSNKSSRATQDRWGKGQVSSDEQAMGLEMSMGVLDERTVDRAIKPHERALSGCFARAGDARKYLSGLVVMRFVVQADGQTSDVQVIKNGLGSYPVERCLIAEGKQIIFPAPEGRRGTDFEYSMSFRSTGERSVIPWNGEEIAHQLHGISSDLAGCGKLAPESVEVIAYVEPGGAVGSVGFVSQGTIDPVVGECTASLIRKVRIPAGPSARSSIVFRATFPMTLAFEAFAGQASRKVSRNSKRRQQYH